MCVLCARSANSEYVVYKMKCRFSLLTRNKFIIFTRDLQIALFLFTNNCVRNFNKIILQ